MMNEQVRRIMTTDPKTVSPDTKIRDASKFMDQGRLHHICVVEDDKLVGLVTTYDLWKNLRDTDKSEDVRIRDVMNTNIIKITPIDKVGTAAELFMDKRFHALPVVNLRGELKGVVTSYDVLKYTLKKEYKHHILYEDVINK